MFDCVGVAVSDMKKSLEFYGRLNLEFVEFGPDHFEAKMDNGFRLMLDTYDLLKKLNPNWKETTNPTTTLGFLQKNPTEVDEIFENLKSFGYTTIHDPWDAFWGQRYASVLDPDGNQIDIFAPLES